MYLQTETSFWFLHEWNAGLEWVNAFISNPHHEGPPNVFFSQLQIMENNTPISWLGKMMSILSLLILFAKVSNKRKQITTSCI